MLAIYQTVMEGRYMNQDYRIKIEAYIAAMLQAKKMLSLGIIDHVDYSKIDDVIAEKYCIKRDSIYRTNYLIQSPFRGNIVHYKEESNE